MLNVYRPVPSDLLAATHPVNHRRALRFLLSWYDAISGAVTAIIALLLVAPLLTAAPGMALWPVGFVLYQLTLITLSRWTSARRVILQSLRSLAATSSWLIFGPRPDARDAAPTTARRANTRELSMLHGVLSLGLTLAVFGFVLTLDRVSMSASGAQPLIGASWLLFVLPVLRAARYSSFYWVIGLAGLGIACDSAALALGAGFTGIESVWLIALHACWLTLISLLPAIALRSLSERRIDLTSAMEVARKLTALTATANPSETAFANQAAAIIARGMGYEEINILLVTSDDEQNARGLRFYGAASQAGRKLVEQGFAVTKDEGITGWCANHNQIRLVNDVARDPDHLYLKHDSFPRTRAEVAFPLVLGGTVAGVLDAQSPQPYAFNDDDIELLSATALHLAVALDSVRRLTRTRGLTTVTQGIARRLLVQQELRPALDEIVQITRETLGADSVVLYPCDQDSGGAGEPIADGELSSPPASAARVARRGEKSAVTQALRASGPRFERYGAGSQEPRSGFVARAGIQAAAILPLRVGAATSDRNDTSATPALGVIFVNYRAPRLFPSEYQEWCAALADLAALALRSALLYQRVAEEERANTWHDIHDGMAQHASMGRMLLEQVASEWERTSALSARGGEKLLASRDAIRALQRQVNYLIEIWRERDTADIWQHEDERVQTERARFFVELDEYASLVRRTLETQCVAQHNGDDAGLPLSLRHDALMIVREAVNNADRHGRATRIEISAVCDGAALSLTITDNGSGFDASRIQKSHGINGIRMRAERRGGAFFLTSSREPNSSGSTLAVTLPLAGETRISASKPREISANSEHSSAAFDLEAVAGMDTT
ncbi:MAG TPA: GAF domain-containing protein [Ktedonobacterales bacterium]